MGVSRPTAGGIVAVVGSVLALALWPSAAFADISNVRNATIDGRANGSSSPPGGVLGATVTATVSGGSTWRATEVTFSTSPAESQCINHSDRGSGTASFNITAPGTPNDPQTTGYDVTFTPSESNSCASGGPSETLIDGLRVTEPAKNPDLRSRCGLDVMLVLDRSGSIDTSGATGAVKAATRAFLDALADTGSAISITDFSTTAKQQVPYTVVTSGPGGSIETTFDPYIDDVYEPNGWTNWEDAFNVVRAANADPQQPNADLVVFITDGDPTARNTSSGGTVTGLTGGDVTALRPAVTQADLVKGQGSHVFAMGVGAAVTNKNSARRLTAVSGFEQYPQEPFRVADFTLVEDFDDLEAAMREIAAEMCGAGVTVTKYVDNGAGYVVDSGWDFTTRVRVPGGFSWVQPGSATRRSATVTTDQLGIAKFQWRPKVVDATSTVRFIREQPREGYSFVNAECQRDAVRRARRRTITRTSLPIVRNVKLKPGEHMTCKVYNRINPGTIAITKEATPEGSQPFDFTGSGALGNFTLVDDGKGSDTHSVDGLVPGTYTVSEIVPDEWELTDIACTPEGAATITPPDVAITLAPGGSVACTFSDLGPPPPVPPEPPPTPPAPPTPPTPPPPTELVVVKDMPRVARVGRRIRFRLRVTNVGTVPALRVQLGDVPPASLALANLSASRQARVIRGNAVWSLGTLNPGETRTVTGSVRIQAGTPGWKRNLALATAVNSHLARDTADIRLIGGGVAGQQEGNAPPVTG